MAQQQAESIQIALYLHRLKSHNIQIFEEKNVTF